ncbi:hypothetical protein LTR50_007199 [Elasticomyces elasticus]|nr:hypothetical protein LTR50_007199 [Elasticomyces elasticus]
MFGSSKNKYQNNSFSKSRVNKSMNKRQRSFKDQVSIRRAERPASIRTQATSPISPNLTSAIITLSIGPAHRLFAAHEDVLCHSPYFQSVCRGQFFESYGKRIDLADEEPEIFSSVLEYLYKGDYTPRLDFDKRRNCWQLQDTGNATNGQAESTVHHNSIGGPILKDTVIYVRTAAPTGILSSASTLTLHHQCAAERYGLPELKRLALKKQGLQSGIQCSTILSSARYAYANTPDSDSKLRAHYLALIIRSRNTFKRSGTMQMEMEAGGRLFFDLFVAMVNHL